MSVTTTAQDSGFLTRLWRLFTGVQASPTVPDGRDRAEPAATETVDGISAYAEVLGVEQTEPSPLELEDGARVKELAAQLLTHLEHADTPPFAMPAAALRVINLVASEQPDVGELSRVISGDPAITAAVLGLANSVANVGAFGEQTTVRGAIARLGTREVGRVAGAVAAQALFHPRTKAEFAVFRERYAALHAEAAVCAAGAAQLSMELGKGRSDAAYLGGMMHDIGKPVALGALASLHLSGAVPALPSDTVIDAVLEQIHARVGTRLHREWSLPEYLTQLCERHHEAELEVGDDLTEAHLVRVIAGLLALRHAPEPLHGSDELLQSARALHITPRHLRTIDNELKKLGERLSQSMSA